MSQCIHEMEEAWCGDCNGKAQEQRRIEEEHRQEMQAEGYFPAQYAGVCSECGKGFPSGSMIAYENAGYSGECCYGG